MCSQVAEHDGDSEFAVVVAKKFAGLQGHKATGPYGPATCLEVLSDAAAVLPLHQLLL